jgi:hypothetical protein
VRFCLARVDCTFAKILKGGKIPRIRLAISITARVTAQNLRVVAKMNILLSR